MTMPAAGCKLNCNSISRPNRYTHTVHELMQLRCRLRFWFSFVSIVFHLIFLFLFCVQCASECVRKYSPELTLRLAFSIQYQFGASAWKTLITQVTSNAYANEKLLIIYFTEIFTCICAIADTIYHSTECL